MEKHRTGASFFCNLKKDYHIKMRVSEQGRVFYDVLHDQNFIIDDIDELDNTEVTLGDLKRNEIGAERERRARRKNLEEQGYEEPQVKVLDHSPGKCGKKLPPQQHLSLFKVHSSTRMGPWVARRRTSRCECMTVLSLPSMSAS